MALRNIVKIGDDILRKKSKEVTEFNERLHTLLDDMWETMKSERGVGLAAPQVGILRRVVIIDVTPADDSDGDGDGSDNKKKSDGIVKEERTVFELINPVVLETSGEVTEREGCLSVPGKNGMVKRPAKVKIQAMDRKGKYFIVEGEGLLAKAIFHELDHLDGVLFVDIAEEIEDIE